MNEHHILPTRIAAPADLSALMDVARTLADEVVGPIAHENADSLRALLANEPAVVVLTRGEELADDVRAVSPATDVYPVDLGDGSRAWILLTAPTTPHPRDIPAAGIAALIAHHPHPLRLAEMRVCARATIAFYPDHEPRVWEYPGVADLVLEHVPVGGRVADIGAGVSPLAPYLTDAGYIVDTVDPSVTRRQWPPRPDWNEWDFLDYAEVGLANASWNTTLERLPPDRRFEGIYSVSVIEHLRGDDRRALLAEIQRRLEPGGTMILTVDVARDTDLLWNKNRGALVEAAGEHGTFQDLRGEALHAGFDIQHEEIVRDWGTAPVDIGVLVGRSQRDALTPHGS